MRLFSFYPQASDVSKAHSLVPGTVRTPIFPPSPRLFELQKKIITLTQT
jgi:hypothetical protein